MKREHDVVKEINTSKDFEILKISVTNDGEVSILIDKHICGMISEEVLDKVLKLCDDIVILLDDGIEQEVVEWKKNLQ